MGYLQSNVARGLKLPPRERRPPRYFLTQDQVVRLLQELEEPLHTLVLTAVLTGLRIGELLALRWCNVDFDRKVIRVREAVYEGHFSTPKTQSGQCDLPMGPLLQQALCRHRTSKNEDAPPRCTRLCQSGRERVQARQFTVTPSPPSV